MRVHRFRAPRWRHIDPLFSEEPTDGGLFFILDFVLGLISAVFAGLIIPLLVIVVETPVAAVRALVSDDRWVIAAREDHPPDRMTWRTDAAHAADVADQVARQLELGYERVEPHNAVFEGFGDP